MKEICLNVISGQALTDQYQTQFSHYRQGILFEYYRGENRK